jgi:hypothetical protein
MNVLVACEESAVVRQAFETRGHKVLSCDLLPSRIDGPHYQGDVFDVVDYPWDLAICHPPCTHTSVSGAKHFAAKWNDGRQACGVAFFLRLWRALGHVPHVCFEHPVSIISTLWRKPDQTIQPWQFGHGETKATCLWLRGLPLLVPTNVVDGREARVHRMPPSDERARLRSQTYRGVADAMAIQWGDPAKWSGRQKLGSLLAGRERPRLGADDFGLRGFAEDRV